MRRLINNKEKQISMANRLNVRLIKQFDKYGIRKTMVGKYELREGTVREGTASERIYKERAERLYCRDRVDRIILLTRKTYEKNLKTLAEEITKKSFNEWRRFPNERLIMEDIHVFTDSLEIIEKKGEHTDVEIIQIDLVSNLYSSAECYFSKMNKNPEELPMILVRILAGLYPREWKEKLPKGFPHYDPQNVLEMIILMNSDPTLKIYLEFFRDFSMKKNSNIQEVIDKLGKILGTPTIYHAGLRDLHLILGIIQASLSCHSVSEVLALRNGIQNYFNVIEEPEKYTEMLFRRFIELFELLDGYQEKGDFQDKLYFLEESRKKIREAENLIETNFVDPFKGLYSSILGNWMDITLQEGGKLLDRPSIEAKLQTKRAIWREKLLVSVNVSNVGIGRATDLKVVLNDSREYIVMGENFRRIEVLHRNRDLDIDFEIRPLKKRSITLLFSVHYGRNNKIKSSDRLFFVEKEEFVPIDNIYNFTRPATEEMFFGRHDLFQWMENNMRKSTTFQNGMISGQRRIGKTSFLKLLEKRISLEDSDLCCHFIDMQLYSTMDDIGFLHEISQELNRKIHNSIPPPTLLEFANMRYVAFGAYVQKILSSTSKRLILIFDEFDRIEYFIREGRFKPGFLLFLRALFQENPRIGAVISGNFDYERMNSQEWQQFFTGFTPKRIGMLDEDSARDLITVPVGNSLQYDQYAIKRILDLSGRNPFYIQVICYSLIDYINQKKEKNFVEIADINAAVLNSARSHAEPTLLLAWNEFDLIYKNILYALSRLRDRYKRSIELSEIEECLRQNDIQIKKWRLFTLLENLTKSDVLVKTGESPPFFDFAILLQGEWIAEHGTFIGE
jgi:hypothetical protein